MATPVDSAGQDGLVMDISDMFCCHSCHLQKTQAKTTLLWCVSSLIYLHRFRGHSLETVTITEELNMETPYATVINTAFKYNLNNSTDLVY